MRELTSKSPGRPGSSLKRHDSQLMQPKWYSVRLRPKLIQTTTGTKAG